MTPVPSSAPKPRVIFINRFYRPDEPATAQLLTDLAEALATRGHAVTVIASYPGNPVLSEETVNGVNVRRVRGTRRRGGGLAGKAVDFASFYCGAMIKLLRIARRGDALVSLTDPPLLGIGVWLVARLRGARLFHWVQDIYPELAIELAGQSWLRLVRPLRDAAWRGAEGCVTLGSDMASVLAAARLAPARISVVPNWAPAGVTANSPVPGETLRATWRLAGKFVVLYSGNFGRVHDLLPVLAVAEALRADSEVVFLFVGDGAQRPALERRTAERSLDNVIFQKAQPRSRLGETLALGDVHLVTLRAGCERFVFPSKVYGIAAVGRPIVFLGPPGCEVARIIARGGFGQAFALADTAEIAGAIRSLKHDPVTRARLGRAAAEFAASPDGLSTATNQWDRLLSPARELAAPTKQP
jgi:colanic acid biosynthesis glycosyl transferase WcaI